MKRVIKEGFGVLLMPIVIIAAVLFLLLAISNLETGKSDEDLVQLQEAVRRATVACYAAEGIYPPNLDYLREHYGIQIDESRFVVDYVAVGSNLMPDITVLEIVK